MMFKLLFGFFLFIHVLGDFYFQSDRLAEKKRSRYKYVALHSLIYLAVSAVCIIPVWSVPMLISAGVLSILHFAIDSLKFLYSGFGKKEQSAFMYVADQLIHLVCIAAVASAFAYAGQQIKLLAPVSAYLSAITNDPYALLRWAGLMLMAYKPANITIKQLVAKYKPNEEGFDSSNKAGAFIGILERAIILLLLYVGQYSAIGLVLTAKSVARYNRISEDRQFAEYYLIGTLLSTLYAIGIFFLFT